MPYTLTNVTHLSGPPRALSIPLADGTLVLPAEASRVLLTPTLPFVVRQLQQQGHVTVTFLPLVSLAFSLSLQAPPAASPASAPTKKRLRSKPAEEAPATPSEAPAEA